MADNNDQEKDKKRSSRTTKITYCRCTRCGGRFRQIDMACMSRGIGRGAVCLECWKKLEEKNEGNPSRSIKCAL